MAYGQFPPGGGGYGGPPGPGYDPVAAMRGDLNALRQEFDKRFGNVAQHIRQRDDVLERASRKLGEIAAAVDVLKTTRFGVDDSPGLVRIENIPGRRVPFTFLVDIPIGANTTSIQQGSLTISQEGPFVAVKRMATFQSAFEFQVNSIDGIIDAPARYSGRSFGRFRPVSSSWDLYDAHTTVVQEPILQIGTAFGGGGGGVPAALSNGLSPFTSAASGFRTMEFDGRIAVINAGSSYPRQNIPVPSAFWSTSINAPWDLGALDFFERGEVITVQASPTHVNNPPVGNADGKNIYANQLFPAPATPGFPFLAGQYDPHEGIVTPGAFAIDGGGDGDGTVTTIENDPIVRLPDGILTLGWEGYRIIQPVAP